MMTLTRVAFRHILSEPNILVDAFAKHGLSINTDCQIFWNVPVFALDPRD